MEIWIIHCCGRIWSLRGVQQNSTRTTVTSLQSLDEWSRKTAVVDTSTVLLKDKRCTTRRNRCLKRPDGESTDAIQQYFHDGTATKITANHCQPRVERTPHNIVRQDRHGEAHLHRYKSWKNSKFETLDSHDKCRWRTSAITQSTTRLCSSENRMQTIAWRAPGKNSTRIQRHSSKSTNKNSEKDTNLEGNEVYDYAGDPETGWRFYKQSRWYLQTNWSGSQANLQTASSSTWDQTQWKTSKWNSQPSSSPDEWWFFLRLRTGFGCLEKKPPANRRSEVWTVHPQITARTGLHSMITFHQANTRGSSSRIAHLCVPETICHPSVMSHQHKFSLTLFIHFSYLSDGLIFAHWPYDSRPLCTLRCSTAEWRICTNPVSHICWILLGAVGFEKER